jgi:predicted site-specific integrase-resolvase
MHFEKLLTPIETAELLRVSVKTLAVWRSSRRYPLIFLKIGRSVRYRLSDVARFAESRPSA